MYFFDSKTTKVSVFGKSTLQDREVKGKITYNQKGDAWTGEATVALDGPVSEVTASYDLKDKAVTLSAALNISGIDLEPEYSLNDKALSLSASKEVSPAHERRTKGDRSNFPGGTKLTELYSLALQIK